MLSQKLIYVQVLRAIAALAVVMTHAQHDAQSVASKLNIPFVASSVFPWGAGVDIFFVISGFIMVVSSSEFFEQPEGQSRFLKRRLIRIVPLYWATTTIFLILMTAAPSALNSSAPSLNAVLASYLFVPWENASGLIQPVYTLGWTLNYEMFFYAIFCSALCLSRMKAIIAVSSVMAVLVLINRIISFPLPLSFWSDPIILEFVFGMWLGLLRTRCDRLPISICLLLGGVGLFLFHCDFQQPTAFLPAVSRALAWGIPAVALVACAAFLEARQDRGVFSRSLQLVGDASYALYLIHPFAVRGVRQLFERSGMDHLFGPWGVVFLSLPASVALAILTYRLFERPITNALRKSLEVRGPRST